ncbi:hypothetical protein DF186_17690, partial [Enterococcus hirae]
AVFEATEIESAEFEPGSDAELEDSLARLRNLDRLRELHSLLAASLDEARTNLGSAVATLRQISILDPATEPVTSSATDLESAAGDLAV